MPGVEPRDYEPMALRPGWVLERHLGWRVVRSEPGLKILRFPRGPFSRTLILARGGVALAPAVRHGLGPMSGAVTVVDFDDDSDEPHRTWAGTRFVRVVGARWFGVGTFVVDLESSESELMAHMAPRERQASRRSREGLELVEVNRHPRPDRLAEFLGIYEPMARARCLELPQHRALERMAASGNLWLARVADRQGVAVMNLVYVMQPSAWYLYGARRPGSPGWAGAVAQWATILALKQAGYAWYDLGLVASRDPGDGIYRFKSALGGRFIPTGSEYAYEPLLFSSARRLAGWLRRGRRRM